MDSSRDRNSRSNPCIPKCGGKEDPTLLGLPKPYAKDGWRWPGIKFAETSIEKGRGEVLILSCAANITTCLHPHPDNSARSQVAFTEETSASPTPNLSSLYQDGLQPHTPLNKEPSPWFLVAYLTTRMFSALHTWLTFARLALVRPGCVCGCRSISSYDIQKGATRDPPSITLLRSQRTGFSAPSVTLEGHCGAPWPGNPLP